MSSFKRYLTVALGLLVCVLTISVITVRHAEAQRGPAPSDVNVVRMPNVVISGTPLVTVANPAGNPVSVRDVDNPDAHPFQIAMNVVLDGSNVGDESFTVPAGKRLIIDQVSIDSAVPVGDKVRISIITEAGLFQVSHAMNVVPRGTFHLPPDQVFDVFEATHLTRLFAEGGSNVGLHVSRNDTAGRAGVYFAISGHLIDE
jgi:hypothetical protein